MARRICAPLRCYDFDPAVLCAVRSAVVGRHGARLAVANGFETPGVNALIGQVARDGACTPLRQSEIPPGTSGRVRVSRDAQPSLRTDVYRRHEPVEKRFVACIETSLAAGEVQLHRTSGGLDGG